jgi:membrane protein required for colicin V production
MNPIDWAIVALVSVSVLLGLWRGLVREVLSLAGWVVGIVLAIRYAVPLGEGLPFDIGVAPARTALAALAIVLATVLAAGIVAWLIGKLLAAVKLSGADRLLGALFGLLRAALILLLVVLFAGRTALATQPLWRESILLPPVEAAVRFASAFLPPSLAERNRS